MKGNPGLLLAMFLLIFGPKINGWIDVVSLTSLVVVAFHFLSLNLSHMPHAVRWRMGILFFLFSVLLAYASTHGLWSGHDSYFQTLRFGRVVINGLGCAALVSFYYRAFGHEASSTIMGHLFHCLVLHAFLMLGMFISPAFRDLIVNQVVQADPDSRTYLAKALGYRIAGLTDSWDALSGLQSLGLLMVPLLVTRQRQFSYVYAAMASLLLLFSVAISGRTGILTWIVLTPLAVLFCDLRRLHRTTWVSVAALSIASIILLGPLRDWAFRAIEETSLGRTVSIFHADADTTSSSRERLSETFATIFHEHYFVPDQSATFVFGTGGSGRDSWDYVPADNGPVLNLHNLGVVSCAAIYGSVLWMLFSGLSIRSSSPLVAGICLLAVLLVLMIDVKVLYLLSRNGFTVMLIPVFVAWWERSFTESRSLAIALTPNMQGSLVQRSMISAWPSVVPSAMEVNGRRAITHRTTQIPRKHR